MLRAMRGTRGPRGRVVGGDGSRLPHHLVQNAGTGSLSVEAVQAAAEAQVLPVDRLPWSSFRSISTATSPGIFTCQGMLPAIVADDVLRQYVRMMTKSVVDQPFPSNGPPGPATQDELPGRIAQAWE